MWIISNFQNKNIVDNEEIITFNSYYFYCNDLEYQNGMLFFCDGHIFSRIDENEDCLTKLELLEKVYSEYSENFMFYVKGIFNIMHFKTDGFSIYSDIFAIKKYFIWQEGTNFIISDDLKIISQTVALKPSCQGIANYTIDYHFTSGTTAFENVQHNQPGQIISYHGGKINYNNYFQPHDLLQIKKKPISIGQISNALSRAIDINLVNIDRNKISLSLTGGADTRNLLALFLSKGIKPHLYTYGDPSSDDCLKASALANGLGLKHTIHDIQMSAEIFELYARKIIKLSGGLASIHRAHRIIAVERECQFAKNMFLGTLGGEFVKGIDHDDYITPSILYENWTTNISHEMLIEFLKSKFVRVHDKNLMYTLYEKYREKPYCNGSSIVRKLNALSYITAHLHDAQDINLYQDCLGGEVFAPFLDRDYLELLFSSKFSFDNKERKKSTVLKKIDYPLYSANFLRYNYPILLNYMYAGEHKPSEVLFNKYYAAIMKVYRKKRIIGKYKPNFPLGKWMEGFVGKNLPGCYEYPVIRDVFHLDGLIHELKLGAHQPKEAYWLKFTNPIMMRFLIEEFST